MSADEPRDPLATRARALFEAQAADPDPAIANRLRLARRAALASRPSPARWWLPLAGATALGALAWMLWPRAHAPAPVPAPVVVAPAPRPSPQVEPRVEPSVEPPAPLPRPETPLAIDDAVVPEGVPDDALAPESLPDDAEPAWMDEEDVELYAWLGDAPVAPDDGSDAL
jgi:hypothetical protein